MLVGGGIGDKDKRPPASIIDEGPQRTVYRYLDSERRRRGVPVLLVPPLAAPATCMDLRPGCSLAEHLLAAGHATYLVDYGDITFSDRELGLEHWVEEVIPRAARIVSEDAGGQPVALVGWCLGGIMSLLAVAGDPKIPVGGVATIASPFDFRRVRLIAPLRPSTISSEASSSAPPTGCSAGLRRRSSATPTGPPRSTSRSSAVGDRLPPRRPRVPGPDRGGGRVHGTDARLPRPHVRPALPPLLPRQRAGRRQAGDGPSGGRPRRRARPRACGGGRERRHRATGGRVPRGRAGAQRARRPTPDRAGRPLRRAHRPRGAPHDMGLPRRVPRRGRAGAARGSGQRHGGLVMGSQFPLPARARAAGTLVPWAGRPSSSPLRERSCSRRRRWPEAPTRGSSRPARRRAESTSRA